jgi:hypothetical protein
MHPPLLQVSNCQVQLALHGVHAHMHATSMAPLAQLAGQLQTVFKPPHGQHRPKTAKRTPARGPPGAALCLQLRTTAPLELKLHGLHEQFSVSHAVALAEAKGAWVAGAPGGAAHGTLELGGFAWRLHAQPQVRRHSSPAAMCCVLPRFLHGNL